MKSALVFSIRLFGNCGTKYFLTKGLENDKISNSSMECSSVASIATFRPRDPGKNKIKLADRLLPFHFKNLAKV